MKKIVDVFGSRQAFLARFRVPNPEIVAKPREFLGLSLKSLAKSGQLTRYRIKEGGCLSLLVCPSAERFQPFPRIPKCLKRFAPRSFIRVEKLAARCFQ